MERKIFNSFESRFKSCFDIVIPRAWWLRSVENYPHVITNSVENYPHVITNTEYSQFYNGYVSSISYICHSNPQYSYHITPVCSI